MSLTRTDLLRFFEEDLQLDVEDIQDDTLVFSTGIADSFMLMLLLTFLEKRIDARIDPAEVTLENLDSISRILSYLQKREV